LGTIFFPCDLFRHSLFIKKEEEEKKKEGSGKLHEKKW